MLLGLAITQGSWELRLHKWEKMEPRKGDSHLLLKLRQYVLPVQM
jgi:hypothetical protein